MVETTSSSLEKENRAESPVPLWKSELRRMSRGSSISSIPEDQLPSNSDEPEFIRLVKKRQERVGKGNSYTRFTLAIVLYLLDCALFFEI